MKQKRLKTALVIVGAALASLLFEAMVILYSGRGCLFKKLLGISCPACGFTRAYKALLRLDFAAAFYYNPAWWTLPVAIALGLAAAIDKKHSRLWLKIFFADIFILILVWFIRLATGTTV